MFKLAKSVGLWLWMNGDSSWATLQYRRPLNEVFNFTLYDELHNGVSKLRLGVAPVFCSLATMFIADGQKSVCERLYIALIDALKNGKYTIENKS